MSILGGVTVGRPNVGQRIVISGVEGIGKTTMATGAPQSLLIPLEQGFNLVQTARLPNKLESWREVEQVCDELRTQAQRGQIARGSSIVWDTATALERLAHNETLARDTPSNKSSLGKGHSMETAHGGYGKAYPIANGMFEAFLSRMDELAYHGGINIILTCHVFAVKVVDPSVGEYDSWELLLHSPKNNKTYGKRELLTQWADGIFFLHEPVFIQSKEGERVALGISKGQGRVLETDRAPAWTAKNRYGLHGAIPIPLENGWNALAASIHKASGIDLFNRA